MSTPERILVRGPNWLGDLVMSTPGFRALRSAHPKARIVLLVPSALAPLLKGSADFDEIWSLPSRRLSDLRAMASRIERECFDLGIVIPESISSALMMRWGRVGRIVGYSRDALRQRLLHEVVAAPPEWGRRRLVSKERFVLGLMEAVGARSSDSSLRLDVTDEESERVFEVLAGLGLPRDSFSTRPPVVMAPGASYGDSKCWPAERFARLADEMERRGESVVLIGTGAERGRARRVQAEMRSRAIDLTGCVDLGGLKAIMSRAKLLVCNDAGARHVAAAFGVPSIVFFGPTSVSKTDANLSNVEVLETEHDCRPCYRRECPIDHRCLTSIDVPEALRAADRLLARSRNRDSRRSVGIAARGAQV
jgi:heptosyltransferase-2